jgi:hypothetical protein
MNVAILKVQNSDECSESGFKCDFDGVNLAGEPLKELGGVLPALTIGTPSADPGRAHRPHPAALPGRHDQDDAPAMVCCSARMELHGAP